MPRASFADIASVEPTPNVARFDDIPSIEPAPSHTARFEDIASIEPLAVATPAAAVAPPPILPTGTITLPVTPESAMAGREFSVPRTPDEALSTLTPPAKPRLSVAPARPREDPITPVVREMRAGVGDAMVGAIDFANRTIGGLKFAAGSRRQGRFENGQLVFDETPPDDVQQQITTGVAGVKEAAQRALSATSVDEAQTAMWQTLGRAAALPADLVGVPVTQLHDALTQKNYGRAAGLITGLVGVLGGMEGAHGLTGEHPGAPIEEPAPVTEPDAAAAPTESAPHVARFEDIAAVEPPAPPAPDLVPPGEEAGYNAARDEPASVDPRAARLDQLRARGYTDAEIQAMTPRQADAALTSPVPQTASFDDIVHIEPPQESVDATQPSEQPSGRLEESRGVADEQLPPQAGEPGAIQPEPPAATAGDAAGEGARGRPAEEAVAGAPVQIASVDDLAQPPIITPPPAAADSRITPSQPRDVSLEDETTAGQPSIADTLAMPNPGRRADASGALVPSPASRAVAAVAPDRQLRPSEIVRQISRDLDALPVRIGKFSQKAYGIYKPKAQTIRLAVANDLATLAHELGHHIHESLLGSEVPPKGHRSELLSLGARTSGPNYTIRQRLQEGQAEFTRRWLMDPAAARKFAPQYAQAFEAALAKHPELEGVLQRAQRQYIGHLSLDPVERGLAHLDFEGGDASPKTDVVTRLQTQWVDDLYPLKRMEQDLAGHQPVNLTESGYALARLARGASAKADGFLRHGVRALDGTFIAPALEPALKPVRKQMRAFAGYLAAQRAVELRGRGMETGMSLEEAKAIVAKFKSPAFDTARDAVYAYQDGLLRYAHAGNLLSKEQYVAIKELNKAYVPFQRVMDDVGAAAAGGGTGGIANKGAATKRIKGSGRDIINPLESIVRNTHTLVAQVEQNRAMVALVDQAEKGTGGGRYLERIPDKQIATSFNLEQLAGAIRTKLVDGGIDIPDTLDFDKLVTVFTPTQLRLGEKGVVSVMKDGARQWFAVNDTALYDAVAGIGAKSSDLVTNLFMKPARYLRAGATTTIGFVARNPLRDTFEAYVNSRYGFRLGYDTVRGLFEYAKHGEDYQAFLNSGAGNAALVGMDRDRLRQELARLGAADKRRILDSTVLNPINLLQAISEATEHATRLGEFMRGVETEGRTAEGYARAALAARDVTIDFARGGTLSKEINRYTAFFNAGVQGTARLAEVFSKDPRGATFRALTAISIPSLALFALNHEDPDYRELPDWERNTYWHIPTSAGHGHSWIRVAKPFTLGQVFGNSWEVALGYLADQHKEDVQRILPDRSTAWRQVISLFPTALMPAVEAYTNYDTFRDRAIVSPDDLQLDPALQYNRWTSDLAKYVGPKIGVAPAKLDHLIYGYGAGVASGTVQLVDRTSQALGLTKAKPAAGLTRTPLVGSFSRETPGADAQSLEDFYRLRDQIQGAKGSITRYEKTEGTAAARARVEQLKTELGANAEATVARTTAAAANLKDLRDGVNAVFVSPSLNPDEKKELLDRLYEQMVSVARAGLQRPVLPSRFTKPPAPELLQKLRAGVAMLDSGPDDRARATAPANGARPQGAAAPAAR